MKQSFFKTVLLAIGFLLPSAAACAAEEISGSNTAQAGRYQYFFLESIRRQSAGDMTSAFELLRHALEISPDAPEACFFMAMYLSEMQQDSLALLSLERAVDLSPNNEVYQEKLAQFYIGTGNYDKAIDAYTRLCDNHKYRTDAMKILLQLLQQRKDYPRMLDVINRIEQVDGESDDLALSKVRIYELMGDSGLACDVLQQLAAAHPYDLNYGIMLGNWYMQNSREDDAFSIFSKALEEEPNNVYAQSSMYDYYMQTGKEAEADSIMEQILISPTAPTDNKLQLIRQAIQQNERQGGDSLAMLALFDRVIAAVPEETALREMKIAYMSMKKSPKEYIDSALVALLDKAPDNAAARFQLIQLRYPDHNMDDIIALSEPGTQYNPEEMVFYYFAGMGYYMNGDDDKAYEVFRKGVDNINDDSEPGIVSDFYSAMGDILFNMGRKQEAYAAYDSCLHWKSDNISCLNNYAYYLSLDGSDLKRAEEMSLKTIQAEPTSTTYLDTYAWILFMQERYSEARIYIDQAMANDSTEDMHSDIYEHAGDIYAMLGNADKAVELWQKAADRGSDSKLLRRKIKKRKYIRK